MDRPPFGPIDAGGSGDSSSGSRIALLVAITIALLLLPLPFLGNLRGQIVPFLCLITAATLLLYAFHSRLGRLGGELTGSTIIVVAITLRLLLLPMLPSLSDDAWRYIWDGRLLLHGVNPYHHVPDSPELARFSDGLLALQGYPTTNTIYPPGAQLLFATAMATADTAGIGYRGGYFIWKILLCGLEVVAIVLLLRLLDWLGLPRRLAILYAWHPLVLVELAGQGHTDGLWALSLALFLYMLAVRSSVGATIGIAIGAVTRLFTLLLIPLWWRLSGRRERVGGIMVLVAMAILFLPIVEPRAFASFTTVGVRFTNYYEFNGGFYRAVKWLLDELHLAPSNVIAGGIGIVVQIVLFVMVWFGWPTIRWSIRRASGLRGMIAPVTAPIIESAPIFDRAAIIETAAAGAMAIITAQLFFGTKVHVWYFVAPLFLAAVLPESIFRRAWLWAALLGPFTYLYYAWEPHAERAGVIALEWGGFVCLVAAALVAERKRRLRTQDDRGGTWDSGGRT